MIPNEQYLKKHLLARRMLQMGFVASIIAIETGLSNKPISTLRRVLIDDGLIPSRVQRSERMPQTLLKTRHILENASLFIQTYAQLAGRDNATRSVNLEAVITAFDLYRKMTFEIDRQEKRPFSINDAYSFARSLRDGSAYISSCSCGCEYYSSIYSEISQTCPFCKVSQGLKKLG